MSLVKSKQRFADQGEVFTPAWMVEAMLDLVRGETERFDALAQMSSFSQEDSFFSPTSARTPSRT
jgi:hypothetical protein